MYSEKIFSFKNLENFNFEETKKNVNNYFIYLETLYWELEKIKTQSGLTANYDFSKEYQKQPYIPIRKDVFGVSAKDYKEEQLETYISSYYWAINILSDKERIYIIECFINRKYEDEIVDMLGFNNSDSNEYRKLKKSAIYKFADFLDLVVEKEGEYSYGEKSISR